ncbi:MAG TPA: hypothetical protein VKO61_01475 [Candidatus Paceibacterota bacterium]|nr:hypothetical protein [Candidatus Paceibacterota bacterium]
MLKKILSKIKSKEFWIFVLVAFSFVLIKVFQIKFKFSDGNIYFYMGDALLRGELPYADFFLASPPLQVLVISGFLGVIRLLGLKLIFLKLVPIIASVISAFFLYLISKKILPAFYSLITPFLYLFSFSVLTTSDYSSGVHLTTMFFVISLYFVVNKKKPLWGGVFSALALLTRLYVAPAILGLLIYLLLKDRKNFLRFSLSLGLIFVSINLVLLGFFGADYFESVYRYHLLKSEGLSKTKVLTFFVNWDLILLILAGGVLFLKRKKEVLLPSLVILTTALFFITYSDIYYLYLVLLIPALSLLAGWTIYRSSQYFFTRNSNVFKLCFVFLLTALLIFVFSYNTAFYIKDHASVANITFLDDISKEIEEGSKPEARVYGSFDIAPLVALESNRRIAGNFIDTNRKTFLTGMYDVHKRTQALEGKVKFVILRATVNNQGQVIKMDNIIEKSFLDKKCKLKNTYYTTKDYTQNATLLFECSINNSNRN